MSLFNWFSSKPAAPPQATLDRSVGSVAAPVNATPAPSEAALSRKVERLAQREFLYGIVRDAMIRSGVLAASYKFKVLSLDARGRQYLIMMDVSQQSMDDIASLTEIEVQMTDAAKAQHDLMVAAVYWRVNAQLTASQAPYVAGPVAGHKSAVVAAPGMADEAAAFKQGLAKPGQIVTPEWHHPAPADEFQDTQLMSPEEPGSPLGATQYGALK